MISKGKLGRKGAELDSAPFAFGDFEKIKHGCKIEEVVTRYGVELRGNMARCPFHEDSTPSFSINPSENYFKCFGCDAKGSVIDFVALKFGIEPFDAVKKLSEDFGIGIDCGIHNFKQNESRVAAKQKSEKVKPMNIVVSEKNLQDMKAYVSECRDNASCTDYFQKRGLSDETVSRFCLGYDKKKNAIVIPYNKKFSYYITRSVANKEFFKPKAEIAGEEPLFNGNVLEGKDPVFVVESPICAISIMQCGGKAVALSGTGTSKLIAKLTESEYEMPLIICLDNDKAGETAKKKLCDELMKNDLAYFCSNIADDQKDPNALLMKSQKALADNVASALEIAKKKQSRVGYKKSIGMKELMNMDLPEIEWLVEDIVPIGLNLIAAPSKIGKSWLMLQLGDALSKGGMFLNKRCKKCDVLYLSLEDTLPRLKGRMNKLLEGKAVPESLHIRLSVPDIQNGLFDELEKELKKNDKIKLIIVDTLQFIRGKAGKNEGVYATDCREMKLLKNFADNHGVGFLLVHHVRKMSDVDSFNRISGSNGLMGTCDNTYIMTKDKRSDELTTFEMTGRDVYMTEKKIKQLDNCSWQVVANAEEMAEMQEKRLYENNDIVRVVKQLLKEKPDGWSGTMDTFLCEGSHFLGYALAFNASKLAREINKLDTALAVDGIMHKAPNGGGRNGRVHSFSFMNKTLEQDVMFA